MTFIKKKENPISYQTLLLAIEDILKNGSLNANIDNFVTMDTGIGFNYCVSKERDIDAEIIREEIITFLFYQDKVYFFTKIIECGQISYKINIYSIRQQSVKHQLLIVSDIEQIDLEEVDKSLKKII